MKQWVMGFAMKPTTNKYVCMMEVIAGISTIAQVQDVLRTKNLIHVQITIQSAMANVTKKTTISFVHLMVLIVTQGNYFFSTLKKSKFSIPFLFINHCFRLSIFDQKCPNYSLINDGECHLSNMNEDCFYDGSDCCPNPNGIGNGHCNLENDIKMCNFDGGDCCIIDKIGDGFCDPLNFNRMCQYDEEDCTCHYKSIANDQCDLINNKYNCDFDGGDCCRKDWIADGFCDKINNNLRCEYDGGDCCPGVKRFVGNGHCNSFNNIEECAYDGGDCCRPDWSNDGVCYTRNDSPVCNYDGGDCCKGNTDTVGNGVCDDQNNNARCGFDGGDCCMANLNTTSCSECKCLTDDEVINPNLICPDYAFIGDGVCQDGNNIPVCHYDGGDCCLQNVNSTACAECECIKETDFDPCPSHQQIADGQCNEVNDNLICSYDGEDCHR